MNKPHISIVIPMYNEQSNVSTLVEQVNQSAIATGETYEIILVNDGSSDMTWSHIRTACDAHQNVRGINLARNFGHQYALLAGLTDAKGQAIISMDGDLQHPPEKIAELLYHHKRGWLVVNTKRIDAKSTSWFKKTTSKLFYKFFSAMTNVEMCEGSSDFRLIDATVRDELVKLEDPDLFLRGAVQWLGFSNTTVHYHANDRLYGQSKYTLSKMINFATGSIISFSTKPLTIAINLGIFISFLAFLELGYIIYQSYSGAAIPGWASILSVVSLMFGVLFIILGVIGTYIARVFTILQKRPRFIIGDRA